MQTSIDHNSFLPAFLSGGGQMGIRIRAFNWSATMLGPAELWPLGLRSVVSICLHSNFPVAIYWGADFFILCNDALMKIVEHKNVIVPGCTAKELWSEIWNQLEPELKKTLSGEAGSLQNVLIPIQRHDNMEECYFDFMFTPIYGEEGKVEGVFNALIETTYRVLHERRTSQTPDVIMDTDEDKSKQPMQVTTADQRSSFSETEEKKYRVLVVDDDANMCEHITSLLKNNYQVITIANAAGGYKMAVKDKPDLIIWHATSLSSDSFDLLKKIRNMDHTKIIPLIFLSEQHADKAQLEELEIDTDDYLITPFSAKELITKVRSQINIANVYAEAEQQMANLFKQAPVAITVLEGPEFIIRLANEKVLAYWNLSLQDVLNKPLFSCLHIAKDQGYKEILRRVFTTGERLVANESPVELPNSTPENVGYYNFIYEPYHNRKGKIIGVIVVVNNVTEQVRARKKIEESETRLNELANAMPQLVWVSEPSGKIIYYNDRIKEFAGAERLGDGQFKWTNMLHPDDVEKTLRLWNNSLQTGVNYEIEHRIQKTNGDYYWHLSRAFAKKNNQHDIIKWYGTTTDIHDQKLAEQLITESEERFRMISDDAPMFVWMADKNVEVTYANQNMLQFYGVQNAVEFTGNTWQQRTHPEDIDTIQQVFGEAYATQQSFTLECRAIEGSTNIYKWLLFKGVPRFLPNGDFAGFMGTAIDIDERKKAEESLQKLATHLQIATDGANVGTWMYDITSGQLDWSALHKKLWGYKEDKNDLVFEDWHSVIESEDKKLAFITLEESRVNHTLYELEYQITRADDGVTRWIRSVGKYFYNKNDEAISLSGISIDITDNKLREQALRDANNQLDLTFKNVPSAIFVYDKNGEIIYLNERGATQLGYTSIQEVIQEKNVYQLRKRIDEKFIIRDEKAQLVAVDESVSAIAFKTKKPAEKISEIMNRATGESVWVLTRAAPLYDKNGDLDMLLTTATDITLQKTAEKQIRRSEEKFRTLAQALPQLVWMTDDKGVYEFASTQWQEYSGLSPQDENTWSDIVHPDELSTILQAWQKSLTTGVTYKAEVRLKNKFGDYRWHVVQGEPLKDDTGKILKWIGAFTDIHDQKTLSEKLENMVVERTLALQRSNDDLQQFAHVASHDLKEPVRKIKTFSSRLQEEAITALSERGKLYLDKVQSAADRMYLMIDGVLSYSTINVMEQAIETINLQEIIANVETDLEIVIQQKNATILYSDLPVIQGASVLIYQLFYNLINNALKFSSAKIATQIIITSRLATQKNESIAIIHVRDNGIGFEQQQAEKIFSTFARLNAKDKYEGTGLGLSLCRKIAERHRGSIRAEGEEGQGATFIITLPVNQQELQM